MWVVGPPPSCPLPPKEMKHLERVEGGRNLLPPDALGEKLG